MLDIKHQKGKCETVKRSPYVVDQKVPSLSPGQGNLVNKHVIAITSVVPNYELCRVEL